MRYLRIAVGCLFTLQALGAAQSWADTSSQHNPYAGQQVRAIKSLSLSPEEVDGYLAGRGLGLSRAAELNGYPGPMHALELANQLGLTEEQRQATTALIEPMRKSAQRYGAELVAAEQALDRLFADGQVNTELMRDQLRQIYDAQRRVREVHLQAHIAERNLLTEPQIARYQLLRGYVKSAAEPHHEGRPLFVKNPPHLR